MPVRRGIPVLAFVAAVFLLAGWAVGHEVDGQGDDADASAVEPTDTTADVTTTTVDPDRPSPERPLRVVLAGDSVMAGLTPPLEAALESEGAAEVRFVLTPSILRDATVRFTWQRELERFNPDVIVMFVGTWELGQVSQENGQGEALVPGNPGWREAYDREVLDPWIDLITGNGAEVVWIGTPAVDNEEVNASFALLNEAYQAAAERWEQVTYVDGGRVLGHPADGYPGGELQLLGSSLRTRQVDGLHLCPDGAAVLAIDVVDVIVRQFDVPVDEQWDDGAWRTHPSFPAETCPPPEG